MCDRAAIAASRCTWHFCVAGCGMGFCSGCSRVNGICFCMNLWTSLLLFCLWVKIALLALERCCLVLFYFCGNNLVVLPHFHLIRSETQFAPPHLHALLIEWGTQILVSDEYTPFSGKISDIAAFSGKLVTVLANLTHTTLLRFILCSLYSLNVSNRFFIPCSVFSNSSKPRPLIFMA